MTISNKSKYNQKHNFKFYIEQSPTIKTDQILVERTGFEYIYSAHLKQLIHRCVYIIPRVYPTVLQMLHCLRN